MKLSEFCIKRPVFATVINLVIILAGVMAYQTLTVREFPRIDIPVVSVSTSYPNASAQIIETQVTKPLEDILSGVEGVDVMSSQSVDERSTITLEFHTNRDIESATNDVRDRVAQARGMLPNDAKESVVMKADADSNAMMWISVSSQQLELMELSEYVDQVLKDKFEMIPGIAKLFMVGHRTPSMRIQLDPIQLSAYDLSVQDIITTLRTQNVEIPSGRLQSQDIEYTVFAKTNVSTEEEFKQLIVSNKNRVVRLGEVAVVKIAPEFERFHARYNTKPTVALGLIKQSTANPLDISKEVHKLLPSLQKNLPEGIALELAYDSTEVIKKSIHSVYKTLFEAVVLVILVIFLFLRSFRATLIPLVTIPISLIGAFAIMALFQYSINTLTMLAMVLAIGLVVDDAIVVLENIHRHVENGMKAFDAAILGMKEIGFAVIAMTITLLAVFTPVAFSSGTVGKLFTEFAVVLAGTVLISGFTALTLSPMMCSKLIKIEKHGRFFEFIENSLQRLTQGYHALLTRSLRYKWVVLVGFSVILAGNYGLWATLKSEITPPEDRGFVISIGMSPEGSSLEYTDKYAKQVEQIMAASPKVRRFFTVVGYPDVKQTMSFGIMPPYKERDYSQFDASNGLNQQFWGIPGIMAFAVNPPSSIGGGGFRGQVAFVIQSAKGFEHLSQVEPKLLEKARLNPKLLNLDSNLKLDKPQVHFTVNRNRAAVLDVDIDTIGQSVQSLIGGLTVTKYKKGAQQYDVIVQAKPEFRKTPDHLNSVYVKSRQGTMVPLSALIEPVETVAPSALNHFNKLPAITLTASLAPDYSLEEALIFLENVTQEVDQQLLIDYADASRTYKQTTHALALAFVLALVVIFLVLAAQFESFVSPFIILFSVPCAMVGALGVLHLIGGSLNIFSQIGLITLIGLITKHGILIVEFTNQLKDKGIEITHALIESCTLRFRPILMTTCATVLGALPLALASGAGAEGRQQIGWCIVGGMLIGTFFTLFVVPVIYSTLNSRQKLVHM